MRDWLTGVVGESLAPIVSVVLAAAVVILLVLLLVGLAKRVFSGTGGLGNRGRAPRLAVLDVVPVDQRRKLVLVRRDEAEHLILIGGSNDIVVEQGILRGQGVRRGPPGAVRQEPELGADRVPLGGPLPHRRIPPQAAPRAAPPQEPVQAERDEPFVPEVPPAIQNARAAEFAVEPARDAPPPRAEPVFEPQPSPRVDPPRRAAPLPEPVRGGTARGAEPVRAAVEPMPALEPARPVQTPRGIEPPAAPGPTVPPQREAALPPFDSSQAQRETPRGVPHGSPAAPFVTSVTRPVPTPTPEPAAPVSVEPAIVAPAPVVRTVSEPRPVDPNAGATRPTAQSADPIVGFALTEEDAAPVEAPRPATQPTSPVPAPMGFPSSPVGAPRSMATPTLPPPARPAPPVAPPLQATPVATPAAPVAAPIPRAPEPATPVSARSLWSPAQPTGESAVVSPPRAEPVATPVAATPVSAPAPASDTPAERSVREAADETPRSQQPERASSGETEPDSRSPLTVRSFASAIQSRRTTPLPLPPVAAAPPAPAPQVEAPVALPARPSEAAPPPAPAPQLAEPERTTAQSAAEKEEKSQVGERPLTLEEEMERLLHDFTLDVTDRR